jgi:hypothetical protein
MVPFCRSECVFGGSWKSSGPQRPPPYRTSLTLVSKLQKYCLLHRPAQITLSLYFLKWYLIWHHWQEGFPWMLTPFFTSSTTMLRCDFIQQDRHHHQVRRGRRNLHPYLLFAMTCLLHMLISLCALSSFLMRGNILKLQSEILPRNICLLGQPSVDVLLSLMSMQILFYTCSSLLPRESTSAVVSCKCKFFVFIVAAPKQGYP